MRTLCYLSCVCWYYLGSPKRKDKTYQGRISKKSYVRVSPAQQNRPEETFISFDSQKLWRPISTFWKALLFDDQVFVLNCIILWSIIKHAIHGEKAYQVSFPTHLAPPHLKITRRSYYQITKGCTEVKQSYGNQLCRTPEEAPSH
jgi:hypothetical protein